MKTVLIEYKSDTFLPKEIAEKFRECEKRISEHPYEDDKRHCDIQWLKGELIRWLADNGIMEE